MKPNTGTVIRFRTSRNVNWYETVRATIRESMMPLTIGGIVDRITEQLPVGSWEQPDNARISSQLGKVLGYTNGIWRVGRGLYVYLPYTMQVNIPKQMKFLLDASWWEGDGAIEDVKRDFIGLVYDWHKPHQKLPIPDHKGVLIMGWTHWRTSHTDLTINPTLLKNPQTNGDIRVPYRFLR